MMSYGRVREYHDDPNYREYRDNDRTSITGLTEQIRSNIYQISSGASFLERSLKSIGTEKDSTTLRDKIHETSQNTNAVVQTTTRLLRSVAGKGTNKQNKIQLDLLTSQFQDAVQRFQTLQKRAAERVKTSIKIGGQHRPQPPLVSFEVNVDQAEASEEQQRRTQVLKEQEKAIEDDLVLIRDREQRIHQLEADILDVNEIFRDLGSMLQAQGEVLDTIDSNVERAAENVEVGNEELVKASGYQRKFRKKVFCLVVIFLVVVVIVTIIIVVSTKS